MKITEEQLRKIHKIYVDYDGNVFGAMRAAIESIPEPIPRLRPISEMPEKIPEGALRLMGGELDNYIAMTSIRCSLDTIFLDVLPTLESESPKLTIQEELVNALDKITKVNESSPVLTYQKMESIAHEALNKAKSERQQSKKRKTMKQIPTYDRYGRCHFCGDVDCGVGGMECQQARAK